MYFFTTAKKLEDPNNSNLFHLLRQRGFTIVHPQNLNESYYDNKEFALVWGTHAFCEFIAQEMNLNLFQNSHDWLVKLPWTYVKRSPVIMTLGELKRLEGKDSRLKEARILYPVDDDCFDKKVYLDYPEVDDATQIYRDLPQNWIYKARFLIKDKSIEDWYCYKHFTIENDPKIANVLYTQAGTGTSIKDFVDNLLQANNTAPACIIDVGYIQSSGFAVIDTQPVWAADLSHFNENKFYISLMRSTTLIR